MVDIKLLSTGTWRCVVWWISGSTLKMEAVGSSKMLSFITAYTHQTTQRPTPVDSNSNI
jgi:hypothetical protein